MSSNEVIEKILKFWFEETTKQEKFQKNPSFDKKIKDDYLGVYKSIMRGDTKDWRETPEGRLAEIIVLDQFTRNMFRNSPRAFEADELTLKLAREAIKNNADKTIPEGWRVNFYMPYMHSESREVHEEALKLFTEYGDEESLKYERKHKEIIDRFGRFPHRNKILGRKSTPEEVEFLKTNSGF